MFLFPDGYEANPIILHASKASKARGIGMQYEIEHCLSIQW